MYFKLLPKAGSHSDRDADGKIVVYRAEEGCVIESEHDLVVMFPNKFERVDTSLGEKAPEKSDVQKAAEEGAKDLLPPIDPPKKNPLGKDVTNSKTKKDGKSKFKFPTARDNDFLVFLKNKRYTIVESDEPEVALNEEPLKKSQVAPFIDKYLKE